MLAVSLVLLLLLSVSQSFSHTHAIITCLHVCALTVVGQKSSIDLKKL